VISVVIFAATSTAALAPLAIGALIEHVAGYIALLACAVAVTVSATVATLAPGLRDTSDGAPASPTEMTAVTSPNPGTHHGCSVRTTKEIARPNHSSPMPIRFIQRFEHALHGLSCSASRTATGTSSSVSGRAPELRGLSRRGSSTGTPPIRVSVPH